MSDRHTDDGSDPFVDELATEPPQSWTGAGATRGPRPPAESVRIIGAEEAAAALEAGHASPRVPEDAPRFGDVPDMPAGPRPPLRFPGADPAAVAKPPVVDPPPPPSPPPPPPPPPAADPMASDVGSFWEPPAPDGPPPPRAGRFEELVGRNPSGQIPGAPPTRPDPGWDDGRSRGAEPAAAAASVPSGARHEEPPVTPSWSPSDPDDSDPDTGGPPTRSWDLFDDPVLNEPSQEVPLVAAGDTPDAAGMSLPHWTEPPSGEHPRILPDSGPPDDLAPWSSLSAAPRWRDQPTDWDATDFQEGMLDDGESRLGALRDAPPADDDDLFDLEEERQPPPRPAARPRGGATQVRTRVPRAPADEEPGGAPPSGSSGGDVRTRVLTGVLAAAVFLVAAEIGPGALVLLVGAALVLATAELFQALRTRGYQPATLLGLAATAGAVAGVYWRGEQAFGLVLTLLVVFTLLWYLLGVVKGRPTMNVAVTVLAFVYVGFLGSFAALLLKFPLDHGIGLLLGAVLATVAFDIGSFFAGRSMGKTLLAPDISPNKTVEGLVGGCALALLVCLAVVGNIEPWDPGKAFWLFVVVCPAALLGDLSESMIKRDLGVKDMGTILPGHGGVLDRIDALLFVVPATYYLVRLLNFY